jgi:hypothetical protein
MAGTLKSQKGNIRKALLDKYPEIAKDVNDLLINDISPLIQKAIELARGEYIIWEEFYELSGKLTITRKIGKESFTAPMFPDKDPDELILCRKVKKTLPPDTGLLQYLINRVCGRPHETPIDGETVKEFNLKVDMSSGVKVESLEESLGLTGNEEPVNRFKALDTEKKQSPMASAIEEIFRNEQ